MQDFVATRAISRGRFNEAVSNLNQEQLNFRIHENSLTIGEMAIHVAGVEIFFASQLLKENLSSQEQLFKSAATDGAVNENPFPFTENEITPDLVREALETANQWYDRLVEAGDSLRENELISALGPIINGEGAFARLSFHPGYHHGQVYMITSSPNFPRSE